MKPTVLAGLLCLFGVNAAWACTLPPQAIITLPAGIDGKLPVMPPDVAPLPTPVPATTPAPGTTPTPTPYPSTCPMSSYYGTTATMPSLNNQEVTDRLGGNINSTPLAPGWLPTQVYLAGAKASFNGKNYTAKWWTQGQQPDTPNGAWQEDANASGVQVWSATRAYNNGEQVVYDGKLYRAKWWTQNEIPGASEWGGWELLGDPPAGTIDTSAMPDAFSIQVSKTNGQLILNYLVNRTITHTFVTNGQCGASDNKSPVGPLAERWEVRLDGVKVADGMLNPPQSSGFPPPPPVAVGPDGKCLPAGTTVWTAVEGQQQSGSATVPVGSSRFLSVWACKGTQCRPTKLLDHGLTGKATVPPPRYINP
ncbi:Chitodextrinase [Andreprevotia lacus DSM 23236]|jgi:chitodextrinase|uniref:Chitodextrinase n=1 Tax=Andreprevotia lacus DSM 23236 TaxID=1121001 RepID=A0A1W1X5B9_9NEIS|nr:carbohydrate-binding protein [Andreprevotia lacus]SMC19105.1 Chitodextrinase [Andreprevotia lacus DSM 23236]